MRAGPEDIPWQAPGGGSLPEPRRALGILWLVLVWPVMGGLSGIGMALLPAFEPGRQDWGAFAAVALAALLVSVLLARWLALGLLTSAPKG
jgi:hypothetical protein